MRMSRLLPVLALAATAGCSSLLDVAPTDRIPESIAIVDAPSARTALAGAYQALQGYSYYGEDFVILLDLSSDNTEHTGTFTDLLDVDHNAIRADNVTIYDLWAALYDGINRVNQLILKVPGISGISDDERNEILGEAYFLRALHYHNLVKLFGGVPLRLVPVTNQSDAAQITRSAVPDVYTQILADLAQAEQLITNTDNTRQATVGAVKALEARVYLYQKDWPHAQAAAEAVEGMSYDLASRYGDLFDANGADTPEDIFRVLFTLQQPNNLGYYYFSSDLGGRFEVGPTANLIAAFPQNDARLAWSIAYQEDGTAYGTKYPTVLGGEQPHVIRFGEVILIRAEALARQGQLSEAVTEYNRIKVRAGLDPDVLGVDVHTQADVVAAILAQRRLELAFEGDRWPDLVRNGLAEQVLGIPTNATLYPIPQQEIDVTPHLVQNPGY